MSNTIIKIQNLSKQYRLGLVGTGTLSHDLKRWWTTSVRGKEDPYLKIGETNVRDSKGESQYVWALKDINLEVEQGEVLGIIGKNGAGKSTLLKLLSRVTKPTTGTIKYNGRIASLLEVGTGFHPELTGRENIYMNGSIMGMTRPEITRKLDEIIAFAGVERYIDTPVKRYSSGMTVRLGFSVAAHLEPDILVVDEVLAVGDAEFQKKAIGKMQDVSKGGGRTVLFVSHNMAAVEKLCGKALVLNDGVVAFEGNVKKAITNYVKSCEERKTAKTIKQATIIHNKDIVIENIEINNSSSTEIKIDNSFKEIKFKLTGNLNTKIRMALELGILDDKGNMLAYYSPGHTYGHIDFYGPGKFEMIERIELPANIIKGNYIIDFSITHPKIEVYLGCYNQIDFVVKGFETKTGFEIDYNEKGFVVMHKIK